MQKDFRNQNLQGRSLRRQDLTEADFSNADIRGVDFTNSSLIGANFRSAKAGHQLHWKVGIVLFAVFLAAMSGYITAYAGGLTGILAVKPEVQPFGLWSGLFAIAGLVIFILITLKKGLGSSLAGFSVTVALVVVLLAAIRKEDDISIAAAIVQLVAIAGAIAGAATGAIAGATILLINKRLLIYGLGLFASISAVLGTQEAVINSSSKTPSGALFIAGFITLPLLALSVYISFRAIRGDKNYSLIFLLAIFIASRGGRVFVEPI